MNKASGGDGIPVELFQILKDDAVKVLHSICHHLENSAVASGLEKVSFHSNPKERQNCTHLTREQSHAQNSPSHALIVREQRTYRCISWIEKRQRNQPTSVGSSKMHESSRKTSISAY